MQKLPMRNKSKNCCTKCCINTTLYILILLVLLFLIFFVALPLVFKYSEGIQRTIVFQNWIIDAKDYSNGEYFHISGVKNFYLNLQNDENVTLGIWHILPFDILSDVIENNEYNYDGILENDRYNILIYLHGNGNDRAAMLELYEIQRKYFQILAVDYRNYADSSKSTLNETAIVNDLTYVYQWVINRSKAKVFVWGHSLGTGIATHLVANLKRDNVSAHGVVLEAPFTSVTDVMKQHPFLKIAAYLPWFSVTMLDPIIQNDFNFDSKRYILDVDCPIMILHAKDDDVIPYSFATELYNTAVNNRNYTYQGNVTYHLFEALNYGHMHIFRAPELPGFISDFVEECDRFGRFKKTNTEEGL